MPPTDHLHLSDLSCNRRPLWTRYAFLPSVTLGEFNKATISWRDIGCGCCSNDNYRSTIDWGATPEMLNEVRDTLLEMQDALRKKIVEVEEVIHDTQLTPSPYGTITIEEEEF